MQKCILSGGPVSDHIDLLRSTSDSTLRLARRQVAEALWHVENATPDAVDELLETLPPPSQSARTIGISGPPGVGKSTLTHSLVREIRGRGCSVW